MGATIKAKRAGTCPECQVSWRENEDINWDKSVKNIDGFSVTCIDSECFKKQGGTITPRIASGFGQKPFGSFRKNTVDVTLKVPDVTVSKTVKASAEKLREYIKQADELVVELYDLPENDQTRGQIRSKFVDQLISIGKGV